MCHYSSLRAGKLVLDVALDDSEPERECPSSFSGEHTHKGREMNSDPCRAIASGFALEGRYVGSAPHGSGHIHETFRGRFAIRGGHRSAIFQRLNPKVFPDPCALMRNLLALTAALRASHESDTRRRVLRPIETVSGEFLHRDEHGAYWRCFDFIEDSRSIDRVSDVGDAAAAAAAFGDFARRLAPAKLELEELIPGFHDTPKRLAHLERAAVLDPRGRRSGIAAEWRQVEKLAPVAPVLNQALVRGDIPSRIAHNDAKINNVLFDTDSGEALCVVDLDIAMSGTSLFDFGDLVRTASCRAPEDSSDLDTVGMDPELYAALREGFLAGASDTLNENELALMPCAGVLITFETGVRFLTDYLNGDVYFRVHHAEQNLHRARCQLRLAADVARRLAVSF